ncbi:MAG TPA: hypothetical protein VIB38_08085 [Aestuariivirgaceae bacterium]
MRSLLEKPEPSPPDWRLLCDLLRWEGREPATYAHLVAKLRALTRALAAGLWDPAQANTLLALSGSNIRDKLLPRSTCFAAAIAKHEFSAAPVVALDLPPSWRAEFWPAPWLVANPANALLLFAVYANKPSEEVLDNMRILLPAMADWLAQRMPFSNAHQEFNSRRA